MAPGNMITAYPQIFSVFFGFRQCKIENKKDLRRMVKPSLTINSPPSRRRRPSQGPGSSSFSSKSTLTSSTRPRTHDAPHPFRRERALFCFIWTTQRDQHPGKQLPFEEGKKTLVVLGSGWAANSLLKTLDTEDYNVRIVIEARTVTFADKSEIQEIADAEKMQRRFMDCLESAGLLHMVVIGGGLTGVELSSMRLLNSAPILESVKALPSVPPMFPKQLIGYTESTSNESRFEILTGTMVKQVKSTTVLLQRPGGSLGGDGRVGRGEGRYSGFDGAGQGAPTSIVFHPQVLARMLREQILLETPQYPAVDVRMRVVVQEVGSETSTMESENRGQGSSVGSGDGLGVVNVQGVDSVAVEADAVVLSATIPAAEIHSSTRSSGRNAKHRTSAAGGQGGSEALKKIKIAPLMKAR
ncbi:hypothetical protein C8J56DRAFT_1032582 [Mycena floridula]|nr:hypothetical protein C8J56DRAFT_1032582 [Mycena floridula]